MRKNHLLNVSLRAYWLEFHSAKRGVRVSQRPLYLNLEGGSEGSYEVHPFLFLPNTVVHVIDEKSPFYELSPEHLTRRNFEIVVVLEGTVESSGLVTQAKVSFLPRDIEWGQRFTDLTVESRDRGGLEVDMRNFDRLCPIYLPSCSAKELAGSKKGRLSPRSPHCSVWIPQGLDLPPNHLGRWCRSPIKPFHSQEWSISNFPCSLTRNIAPHSMENLAFHRLLEWKLIILPILATSLVHYSLKGWEDVIFVFGSERGKGASPPCISTSDRINNYWSE